MDFGDGDLHSGPRGKEACRKRWQSWRFRDSHVAKDRNQDTGFVNGFVCSGLESGRLRLSAIHSLRSRIGKALNDLKLHSER